MGTLRILAVCLTVALAGCASQIMQGYMGKTLQEVMIDYGPPANAFDMPDGSRAFQWIMSQSYTMPVTATRTGQVTGYGNMALWSSRTQITGGQTINNQCAYTMIAHWEDAANAWVFSSYRKPRAMCE